MKNAGRAAGRYGLVGGFVGFVAGWLRIVGIFPYICSTLHRPRHRRPRAELMT